MGYLKIGAWVFIDFGTNLWEDPEEARSLAQWKIVYDKNKAFQEAERLGMHGSSMIDTSSDGTKRMLAVLESEIEIVTDWDLYARRYVYTITEGLQNLTIGSICGCGMLTGGCGCGAGCACGSSESCKCG